MQRYDHNLSNIVSPISEINVPWLCLDLCYAASENYSFASLGNVPKNCPISVVILLQVHHLPSGLWTLRNDQQICYGTHDMVFTQPNKKTWFPFKRNQLWIYNKLPWIPCLMIFQSQSRSQLLQVSRLLWPRQEIGDRELRCLSNNVFCARTNLYCISNGFLMLEQNFVVSSLIIPMPKPYQRTNRDFGVFQVIIPMPRTNPNSTKNFTPSKNSPMPKWREKGSGVN